MIIDQFREYNGYSTDIGALKLRARLFAVGAMRANDIALASKLFKHARTFARRAHYLENMERIQARFKNDAR